MKSLDPKIYQHPKPINCLPPTAVWSWPRTNVEAAQLAPHVWLPEGVAIGGGGDGWRILSLIMGI